MIDIGYYKKVLEGAGVIFQPGLNDNEIARCEQEYGIHFPPDLREFLQFSLPVSGAWINWRDETSSVIRDRMNWIFDGFCFDIEHNSFWPRSWGERPKQLEEAFSVAKAKLAKAPKLIPICSHRYIPDYPNEIGNPVFSVHQTDIIYYGSNLYNYFENEFYYYFGAKAHNLPEPIKEIDFWTKFALDDDD